MIGLVRADATLVERDWFWDSAGDAGHVAGVAAGNALNVFPAMLLDAEYAVEVETRKLASVVLSSEIGSPSSAAQTQVSADVGPSHDVECIVAPDNSVAVEAVASLDTFQEVASDCSHLSHLSAGDTAGNSLDGHLKTQRQSDGRSGAVADDEWECSH